MAIFDFPDELLEKHGFGDTEEETSPESETTDETTDDDLEDDEVLEDDDDTDEEESGDETDESTEDDEEDDTDESEEDDEEVEEDDEEESFLPEFDRSKFLKEHPELEAPYKHFQAAFTRKSQELASARGEVEQARAQLSQFAEQLQTEEGTQDFLLRVALSRPEVFEAAYERFAKITEDDSERTTFIREQKLKDREAAAKAADAAKAQETYAQRTQEIVDLMSNTAQELGLPRAGMEVAKTYVLAEINRVRAETGEGNIDNDAVIAAVKKAAKDLGVVKKNLTATTKVADKVKGIEAAKKRLKQAKKAPPAKSRSKAVKAKGNQGPLSIQDYINRKITGV